ncbi:hypothetical protein [Nocardia terpenica]|uniref:hypothetical protein n=1 Tax=Nocardia terpenica TaxID=455432 RepID=UPI001EEB2EC1|nr:hypothetical protein [Nocardia terpenica]
MRVQFDEEPAIGKTLRQQMRRTGDQRGFADTGHAVDGVDGHHPSRSCHLEKLVHLGIASDQHADIASKSGRHRGTRRFRARSLP